MVKIYEVSTVDGNLYPMTRFWDQLVRANWKFNQNLIDKQTYFLQRVQRYLFSMNYPLHYQSEIETLNLLKKKQKVGEVTNEELQIYKTIDPSIRAYYERTFGGFFRLPKEGFVVGLGLLAFTTFANCSMPMRLGVLASPLAIDWFRTMRSSKSEIHSSQFLDWVIQYRKAKSFNEYYSSQFSNPQTKKILKNNNLTQLGQQMIRLAKSSS